MNSNYKIKNKSLMSVDIFLEELSRYFSGDIENKFSQNFVQSTDNSIHQVIPDAIIYPKNANDISLALKLAQKESFKDIKFTPRGGFTATNGQSLNKGIIIDCSRHFNKILQLNLQESWVEVESGVVLKDLNDFLKPHGYQFAVNISTANRAVIGGMVATDACGKGSYVHGKTSDNLILAHAILSNSEEYVFKNSKILDEKTRKIYSLIKDKNNLIKEKFPKNIRFASGYNLGKLLDNDNNLAMNYLLSGSEGTLGITTNIRLKITKINSYKALIVAHYDSFLDSLKDANNLLKFQPYALEVMDEEIMYLATSQSSLSYFIKNLIQDSKNIAILEFQANCKQNLEKQINDFLDNYAKKTLAKNAQAFYDEEQIDQIWNLRSLGVGIAGNLQGNKKPIAFMEDSCVPVSKISNYIIEVKELLKKHNLYHVIYGHLDVGCLHIRPALDLTNDEDKIIIRQLLPQIIKLVKKYDGVVWGEHSAGYRVEYSKDIFGEEIYDIFCQIKNIFDPYNRLNPGKIAGDDLVKIDENLQADFNKNIDDNLKEKFKNVLSCNGNATCLSVDKKQIMCPSYKVTKERLHSPKGRSNLIRNWLFFKSQNPIPNNFIRKYFYKKKHKNYLKEIYDSLDGCLSCSSCATSCPVSVNIPDQKILFLNWYHNLFRRNFRDFIFSKGEQLLEFGAKYSFILKLSGGFSNFLNICKSPKIYNNFYYKDIQKYVLKDNFVKENLSQNTVIIVADNFIKFGEKDLLKDHISLLEKMNFEVKILSFSNFGIASLNNGKIKEFEQIANKNIKKFNSLKEFPLIFIEPTIYALFKEKYQKFEIVSPGAIIVNEFLFNNLDKMHNLRIKNAKEISIFSHCVEKSLLPNSSYAWQEIFKYLNFEPKIIETGCCGMAGDYGYKKENLPNSKKLFELSWKKPLKNSNICAITGFSCRSQIKRFSNLNAYHPIQIINHFSTN